VPLAGTPYELRYQSDRVLGRTGANTLHIPLSGPSVPASLKAIRVEVTVAGQHAVQEYRDVPANLTNLTYTFPWDGRDAYGRLLQGEQPVSVRIGYLYQTLYTEPAVVLRAFARYSNGAAMAEALSARLPEITLWKTWGTGIGAFDARALSLGGWMVDVHHVYDPHRRVVYFGNGAERSADAVERAIVTVAGDGIEPTTSAYGDGGLAINARFKEPIGIAVGADGSVFVADQTDDRVRKIDPSGSITTVAGGGTGGLGAEGVPATTATLGEPRGLAIGPDGSLYLADRGAQRIRRVAPDAQGAITGASIITTVAGTGASAGAEPIPDGGGATATPLGGPVSVAAAPDGSLYIVEAYDRVRQISPDGFIHTVAGGQVEGYNGDDQPAANARLKNPTGVAVGPDGSVYIADQGNKRVRRIGPTGVITTVAGLGTGHTGEGADGDLATEADVNPLELAVGPGGSLYIIDANSPHRVRVVGPSGIIRGIAGGVGPRAPGTTAPARRRPWRIPTRCRLVPTPRSTLPTGGRAGVAGIVCD
jgi:streptogramin lyase